MRPEMSVVAEAAEECRESYVRASRFWTLLFWGVFVVGVAALVVASRLGWLPGVWWEVKP